jgi:hypothetical protein
MMVSKRRTWTFPPQCVYRTEGYGGYSDAAALLARMRGRPVSRQWVYSTWKHRSANGFPDLRELPREARDPLIMFSLAEIAMWERARAAREGRMLADDAQDLPDPAAAA